MQKNARAPLAEVYDDKSILEHMHYALLLSLMRNHGLGTLLDRPEFGAVFRKVLFLVVLATDMSMHVDFMAAFKAHIQSRHGHSDTLKRRILTCQALIKCADISNPVSMLVLLTSVVNRLTQTCRVVHIPYPNIGRMHWNPNGPVKSCWNSISIFQLP